MTFRERLIEERPDLVDDSFDGFGRGCPDEYGYESHCESMRFCPGHSCDECWDRIAPELPKHRGVYQPTKRLTSEPPNCDSAAQTETPTYRRMSEPPKPTPTKRRKVVYIAGPITGVAKYWEPFEEMAEEVRAAGYIPLIPTWQPEGLSNAQYMRMCLAMLDAADAVLLLPGWRDSIGATIEATYAGYVDKPIFENIEKLKEVLDT